MNAIIGMSELALREDAVTPSMGEYLNNIRQAGSNLLSIINDILDLSKIESGGLRLNSAPYTLSSLINNVINVIRVRLSEKPILFLVNIDAHIPNNLTGDEVRFRQILFNILSNAVKYTHTGFIKLTMTGTPLDEQTVLLEIVVADSGIGIREADQKNLFDEFIRFDLEHNKEIEGTGLGLAITKRLCRKMGGDIGVASVYGLGSVFTAKIPQLFSGKQPLAFVENPGEKRVLLYDERPWYAESVCATLQNLGVAVSRAVDPGTFLKDLGKGEFSFAFISIDIAKQAADFITRLKLRTTLVLLADLGEMSSFQNIPIVLMPAYAVSIANILNGYTLEAPGRKTLVRFTAPEARILIVDDIKTNLKVAQGLLTPYQSKIDLCETGNEAVSLVKANRYDIIFMDHMMPVMDGIQAAAEIRSLEGAYFRQVPIIALTANAIAGMREMFLRNGFNDYLAKPIELTKLNDVMERWIPQEKRLKPRDGRPVKTVFRDVKVHGLDIARGISLTGGTETEYQDILALYCRDCDERLTLLSQFARRDRPAPEDLLAFTIQVHALKSASASIGAPEISEKAALLEKAGKDGDLGAIQEGLAGFIGDLGALVRGIREALISWPGTVPEGGGETSGDSVKAELARLRTALVEENVRAVDAILKRLDTICPDAKTKQAVNNISDNVLISEFQRAMDIIDDLMESL
jgi:CheY-like chemotaxis protein